MSDNRPRPHPTLSDVAEAAGVSSATVSRCLNAPERVAEATRARVEAAVAALGYTPHFAGMALASKRTNTVGAVIPTMDNAIFARALQAMEETLAAEGVTLLVASSGYDPEREALQVRALLGRGVDGLLLIGAARPAPTYALLEQRGVPLVLAWTDRAGQGGVPVGFDNAHAAKAMAERVLDLGHRHLAMIAGLTTGNDRATARVAGVRAALGYRGLALAPERLIEAPYTLAAGEAAFATLMAQDPRPTAVLCGNDVLAAGALRA
ncbi:MAG: LacI family DNA-binding transcriptional regulator, partial [Pseudomonadota bacterium]